MCCILTCCGWLIDLFQRLITFSMSCCISGAICCVMLISTMAGVALGYNYSLAEYIDLRETNVSVYLKRGVFDDEITDDLAWRRAGHLPVAGHLNSDNLITGEPIRQQGEFDSRRSNRKFDDSIYESEDTNRFEGSLIKLVHESSTIVTTAQYTLGDANVLPQAKDLVNSIKNIQSINSNGNVFSHQPKPPQNANAENEYSKQNFTPGEKENKLSGRHAFMSDYGSGDVNAGPELRRRMADGRPLSDNRGGEAWDGNFYKTQRPVTLKVPDILNPKRTTLPPGFERSSSFVGGPQVTRVVANRDSQIDDYDNDLQRRANGQLNINYIDDDMSKNPMKKRKRRMKRSAVTSSRLIDFAKNRGIVYPENEQYRRSFSKVTTNVNRSEIYQNQDFVSEDMKLKLSRRRAFMSDYGIWNNYGSNRRKGTYSSTTLPSNINNRDILDKNMDLLITPRPVTTDMPRIIRPNATTLPPGFERKPFRRINTDTVESHIIRDLFESGAHKNKKIDSSVPYVHDDLSKHHRRRRVHLGTKILKPEKK